MCKDNHASRWIRLGLHSFHLPRHLAPLVAKPWMWVHYACCPNTKHLLNPRPSLPTIAFESLIKVSLYANYLKDLHFDIASQKILLEIKSCSEKWRKYVHGTVCFVHDQLVYHQWINWQKLQNIYYFDYPNFNQIQ